MRFFVYLALLSFLCSAALAQPPCYQAYKSHYGTIPLLTSLPPLNTSMSFNEIIGHIALDSICRTTEVNRIDSFMQARLTWDDTVKSMYKYMTTIVDRNPLLVFGISQAVCEWRYSFPDEVRLHLLDVIGKHSPNRNVDLAIAKSDYILTIVVSDTSGIPDSSAHFARTSILASGNVTDTILGQEFPICSSQHLFQTSSSSGPCIAFDVRREQVQNLREMMGLDASDSIVDHILPKPNRQYLVFLKLVRLCTDTSNLYFTVLPVYSVGARSGIFEISNNRISDEQNYFNLGPNPLAADVIAAIETRIAQIKSWVP